MSIKQIAKLANVSIGTVDRVLHQRSGVSVETQKKVKKIIKEIGYTKNTTASRLKLASKKKIKIAILIPQSEAKWNYWKLPKIGISNAINELTELGVKADYFNFLDSSTFIEQGLEIFNNDYDGVVTVPFFKKESNILLKLAKTKNIPIVFLDTEITLDYPANFIRQNSHKAGMVAGRLLNGLVGENGQYFIVNIINDKGIQANGKQRENGFKDFFKSMNQHVNIKTLNYSISEEFSITKEIINLFRKNTSKGIFVTNSRAHIIPPILKKHQINNTFIVGFDMNNENINCLKNNEINFIINQKPEYQGYAAIKALFKYLTTQDSTDLNHDISVDVILKENC